MSLLRPQRRVHPEIRLPIPCPRRPPSQTREGVYSSTGAPKGPPCGAEWRCAGRRASAGSWLEAGPTPPSGPLGVGPDPHPFNPHTPRRRWWCDRSKTVRNSTARKLRPGGQRTALRKRGRRGNIRTARARRPILWWLRKTLADLDLPHKSGKNCSKAFPAPSSSSVTSNKTRGLSLGTENCLTVRAFTIHRRNSDKSLPLMPYSAKLFARRAHGVRCAP